VLFEGLLYFTTQFNEIIALDPSTGVERWKYQPELRGLYEGQLITSRGVATWSSGDRGKACSRRIFEGTNDAQLVALDAETGLPCQDFGQDGKVDLRLGLKGHDRDFHVTSAPTVLGDIVVVGSSIPDDQFVDQAKGTVRAFDVMTGKPVWIWEPIAWGEKWAEHTGAANSWSTIAADPSMGLLFIPTGSPSPDYFGGLRPGDDRDADSVVAIEAATGKKVWAFQVVHHDLWDYDVASEPLLFTWHEKTPAVAITTKMGMVFVLDRRTGEPLFPVEERPVPKSDIAGEFASATQPFSAVQSLSPLAMPSKDLYERTPSEADYCRQQMSKLRYDGIYTPPSLKGSLIFPGNIGGVNWGSAAYDPQSGNLYANTNRLPYAVQLIPQDGLLVETVKTIFRFRVKFLFALTLLGSLILLFWKPLRSRWTFGGLLLVAILTTTAWYQTHSRQAVRDSIRGAFGDDYAPQKGAPYRLHRQPILDREGMPCTPGLFGTISALNLQTGKIAWEKPHGSDAHGAPSLGGVIVTAGGLLFSAGTRERFLWAYDSSTGDELWKGELPFPAQSTPMTYESNSRQFVVIAAGGHGLWGTSTGDALVAFTVD
jgi:quinoprotein glucose dehydrogenase